MIIPKIEVCLETLEAAVQVQRSGVDRIELCGNLAQGGTTPSAGLCKAVVQAVGDLPVRVMLRPRGGNFVYSDYEMATLLAEIPYLIDAGASGFVFGSLDSKGNLHQRQLSLILDSINGYPLTYHRAIDRTDNLESSYSILSEANVDCVLSSGGEPTALKGVSGLKRMKSLNGKTTIMPGSGINPTSIPELMKELSPDWIHFSVEHWKPDTTIEFTDSPHQNRDRLETNLQKLINIKETIASL